MSLDTRAIECGDVVIFHTLTRDDLVGIVSAFLGDDLEVQDGFVTRRVPRHRINKAIPFRDLQDNDWTERLIPTAQAYRRPWAPTAQVGHGRDPKPPLFAADYDYPPPPA